jgi:hypothetical protein
MALVIPSSRLATDATRWGSECAHVAVVVALEERSDAPVAPVDEGSRRERVRMELLVERARAARRPQP